MVISKEGQNVVIKDGIISHQKSRRRVFSCNELKAKKIRKPVCQTGFFLGDKDKKKLDRLEDWEDNGIITQVGEQDTRLILQKSFQTMLVKSRYE